MVPNHVGKVSVYNDNNLHLYAKQNKNKVPLKDIVSRGDLKWFAKVDVLMDTLYLSFAKLQNFSAQLALSMPKRSHHHNYSI